MYYLAYLIGYIPSLNFAVGRAFCMAMLCLGALIIPGQSDLQAQSALYEEPLAQLWQPIDAVPKHLRTRRFLPDTYRLYQLDVPTLKQHLHSAPQEYTRSHKLNMITLPLPDGQLIHFKVEQSGIMEPRLAEKFPLYESYTAHAIGHKHISARIDWRPEGLHALIFYNHQQAFIDPYREGNTQLYISYWKREVSPNSKPYREELIEDMVDLPERVPSRSSYRTRGDLLRYRLAVAATGEYTNYHGGTVEKAMGAIFTTLNRINGVLERDLSIRLMLVANNEQIVFEDNGNDPFSEGNLSAMLNESQLAIDQIIGSQNYDIGHLFSTDGGGVARGSSVCDASRKASGVTGVSSPEGDAFDIDLLLHELGHQFGASHTFNNCGSFGGGGIFAFEPGSGSTIMAYAGLCDENDIQSLSDDYFHSINLEQIYTFTRERNGLKCAQRINGSNRVPFIVTEIPQYTLPMGTPFELRGEAKDSDGDTLTYCWEQMDLGPKSQLGSPMGNAPLFRSYPPSTSPSRVFPQLKNILSASPSITEVLPSYTRNINLRLTVRDNHPGGGAFAFQNYRFKVTDQAGPFKVIHPNSLTVWKPGEQALVSWDVAHTDLDPVSCSHVDIYLSLDGGQHFPHLLAEGVPNNGVSMVSIPREETERARIKVACANNVFFDISDTDFVIDPNGVTQTETELLQKVTVRFGQGQNSQLLPLEFGATSTENLIFRLIGMDGRELVNTHFSKNQAHIDISVQHLPKGIYFYQLLSSSGISLQSGKIAHALNY